MKTTSQGLTLREQKNVSKKQIFKKYSIDSSVRACILLDIQDITARAILLEACSVADIAVIYIGEDVLVSLKNVVAVNSLGPDEYFGFDAFIVADTSSNVDIMALMRAWVVPILPRVNHLSSSLHEFDPIHFEGNSFLFSKVHPYAMFEKVISYLENIKFPEDRRILLKNVSNTFA